MERLTYYNERKGHYDWHVTNKEIGDKLAAYEDAEEHGLLVLAKDREIIRRALTRYWNCLESELYEILTHGESDGVRELQTEIALVEAALKED